MTVRALVLLLCAIVAIARPAAAETQLQRYTLILGANFGGADRPLLKYGVSDAERFLVSDTRPSPDMLVYQDGRFRPAGRPQQQL